ncbi:MAG: hypothetical protein ACRDNZ_06440, partial [Streptosporangiaceae bacterium]
DLARLWADDLPADDDRAMAEPMAEPAAGLVTIGYLRAAIRRSRLFIGVMAAVGLVTGAGLLVLAPPAYQATATLLLSHNPNEDPVSAQATDAVLAQSDAVALAAMRTLGLTQSPRAFESSYTVTIVTSRILVVVFRAPSRSTAVRDLNALAAAFLQFRAGQLRAQQQGAASSLAQQVTQAGGQLTALDRQITQLRGQPSTPAVQAQIALLQDQHASAASALSILTQTVRGTQASTQVTTTTIVAGSTVLNGATPIPRSHLRLVAEYVLGGLIGGLALGVILILLRTLVSDKLRRRDDVARILRAPVRRSVVAAGIRRRRPGSRGLAAAKGRDLQRVIAYLASEASPRSEDSTSLAVVPAGDPRVAAVCVAGLAISLGRAGKRVVLADLSPGGAAGRLLGVTTPGLSKITADGAHLVLFIPQDDDVLPLGPLQAGATLSRSGSGPAEPDAGMSRPGSTATCAAELAAASSSADLLLTLATLDPACGAEHLATWAAKVVAVIRAGQSSATRIQALGEMVRLAGLPLAGAVLVGADKTDESMGVAPPPGEAPLARPAEAAGGFR